MNYIWKWRETSKLVSYIHIPFHGTFSSIQAPLVRNRTFQPLNITFDRKIITCGKLFSPTSNTLHLPPPTAGQNHNIHMQAHTDNTSVLFYTCSGKGGVTCIINMHPLMNTHTHTHTHTCAHIHACTCAYIPTYSYMHMCIHTHIYTHKYKYTHTHTHTQTCIHSFIHSVIHSFNAALHYKTTAHIRKSSSFNAMSAQMVPADPEKVLEFSTPANSNATYLQL